MKTLARIREAVEGGLVVGVGVEEPGRKADEGGAAAGEEGVVPLVEEGPVKGKGKAKAEVEVVFAHDWEWERNAREKGRFWPGQL